MEPHNLQKDCFTFEITIPSGDVFRVEPTDEGDLIITRPDTQPFVIESIHMDGKNEWIQTATVIRLNTKQ